MCGIVAVFGKENAAQNVLAGLKHLEYRGYDSWGIGALGQENIIIQKEVGKISNAILNDSFCGETIAFGHTRWATHGGVTPENAHPHGDEENALLVVQNGIVENFLELRSELRGRGHIFSSDTDTEVFPHLIEEYLAAGEDLLRACKKASDRCLGRFSFVVMKKNTEEIVAVRNGSPLIAGIGENGEYFLASDTPAFLEHTKTVHYIDDGEILKIDSNGLFVYALSDFSPRNKRKVLLDQNIEVAEKGEHAYFMVKEIFEQKETVMRATRQNEKELLPIVDAIKKARGTFLIGCGTAHKMGEAGEYFFSQIAKRHINTIVASEFPLFHDFLRPESLVIAISQSGETADVIEAIEAARDAGSKVLSIVNVKNSTIARMSDFSLFINAGVEKAVASTKASTSQLAVLLLLAFACADKLPEGRRVLIELSAQINEMINPRFATFVESIAQKIAHHENMFIIGKGANFPMAREAAIKIQEVSYIHAEGFAGGELKHGPIAMIENGTPCLVLVSDDPVRKQEILSNAMEIRARGGYIIGIAPENSEVFDDWIRVPTSGPANAIVNLIPVQMLAYFLAILRGNNPDQPRNLAKSVTVK